MTVDDSNWKCCTVFCMCVCGNNGKESGSVAYGDTTCKYLQAWSHLASCFWAYVMEVLSKRRNLPLCMTGRKTVWIIMSKYFHSSGESIRLKAWFPFLLLLLFNPHEIIASLLNILPEILKKTNFGC